MSSTRSSLKVLLLTASLVASLSASAKDSKDAKEVSKEIKSEHLNDAVVVKPKRHRALVLPNVVTPSKDISEDAKATIDYLIENNIKYTVFYSNIADAKTGNHYIVLVGKQTDLNPPSLMPEMGVDGDVDDYETQISAAWSVGTGIAASLVGFGKDRVFTERFSEGFGAFHGLLFGAILYAADGPVTDTIDLHDNTVTSKLLSWPFWTGYRRNGNKAYNAVTKFKAEVAEKIENEEMEDEILVVVKRNLFTAVKGQLKRAGYRELAHLVIRGN